MDRSNAEGVFDIYLTNILSDLYCLNPLVLPYQSWQGDGVGGITKNQLVKHSVQKDLWPLNPQNLLFIYCQAQLQLAISAEIELS